MAIQQWVKAAEDAHVRTQQVAQEYPKDWSLFQRWMDGFLGDVATTQYGTERHGHMFYPTASGWTGRLFIIVGGVLGIVLYSLYANP